MKSPGNFLIVILLVVVFQGCYTVIWTPEAAFPTKEKSENTVSYYEETYYGEYSTYYELPWWYTVPPPPSFTPLVIERENEAVKLRDGGSGDRGTQPRRDYPKEGIYIVSPPVEPPSTTDPVTVSQPTTTPATDDNQAAKKSESTTQQRDKGNSSNSRDTRNNDGSRSSDTPRR